MTIRCVIVDDEPLSIKTLSLQLREVCPHVEIVYTTTQPKEAVEYINSNKKLFDLLFLDIEMPEINGFTLLSHLSHHNFSLIFTTAYNQYAIRAFKVSAVDYLLKPIDEDDLINAISRVEDTMNDDTEAKLKTLYMQLDNTAFKRVALPTMDGLEFIDKESIKYLLSDGSYSYVHLTNGKYVLCAKAIGFFEDKLKTYKEFFRIHQSHIINMNYMTKYVKGNAGYVVMDDGKNLNVSRAKKKEFLEQIRL